MPMIGAALVLRWVVMGVFTCIAVYVDMIVLVPMRMAMFGAIRVAVLVGVFVLMITLALSHGGLTSDAIGLHCIQRKA